MDELERDLTEDPRAGGLPVEQAPGVAVVVAADVVVLRHVRQQHVGDEVDGADVPVGFGVDDRFDVPLAFGGR